jgi:predicted DNA-binding transcriptional regulator AlpA
MGNYVSFNPMMPFLSPKQVSKVTGISVRTLARMRESGTGPKFHRFSPRKIQYHANDVNQWIAERQNQQ